MAPNCWERYGRKAHVSGCLKGVSIYREQERAFSVGDRVQLTAPSSQLKLANRELGTVAGIEDGRMALKLDDGRTVALDPPKHPHLDHGYAVTSHSSQGQTADRVLILVDTELAAKDLLNHRMAYVAVSRGAYDAQLFTNDREGLSQALGRDVSHLSAHPPEVKIEQAVATVAPEIEMPTHRLSIGMGLELVARNALHGVRCHPYSRCEAALL